MDDEDDPAEFSTPMTVMGTPLTLTVSPTGSRGPKSSCAVVGARTVTAASVATSWWLKNLPSERVRPRTDSQSTVEPTTVVVQLADPAVRVSEDETVGATALMSGATRLEAKALPSATVKVEAEPNPPRIPLLEVELPGETVSRLVPKAEISEATWAWAPSPSPTVMITAAMPMRMPSTVRAERIRCVRIASRPVRNVSSQLIVAHLPRSGRRRQRVHLGCA